MICLQPLNLPEKEVDLVPSTPFGIPIGLLHRRTRSTSRKGRRKIPNIKPHRDEPKGHQVNSDMDAKIIFDDSNIRAGNILKYPDIQFGILCSDEIHC